MSGVGEPQRYLLALALTLLVEAPLYAAMLRAVGGTPFCRGLLAGSGVNLVSHPSAFLVLTPLLLPLVGGLATFALVEGFAVTAEAIVLRLRSNQDVLEVAVIATVANAASVLVGLLVIG